MCNAQRAVTLATDGVRHPDLEPGPPIVIYLDTRGSPRGQERGPETS